MFKLFKKNPQAERSKKFKAAVAQIEKVAQLQESLLPPDTELEALIAESWRLGAQIDELRARRAAIKARMRELGVV